MSIKFKFCQVIRAKLLKYLISAIAAKLDLINLNKKLKSLGLVSAYISIAKYCF